MIPEIKWKAQPDLSPYFSKENFERVKLISEKRFRLKDTGISPYVFNQWKKHGLITIPLLDDNRKWVSLSFVEWVWLKMIDDLRKFGCPIQDILSIKTNILFNVLDHDSEKINSDFDEKVYEQLEKSGILTHTQIAEAKQYLNDNKIGLKDFLKKESQEITLLETALLHIALGRSEANLILYLSEYIYQEESIKSKKVIVKERQKRLSGMRGFLYFPEFNKMDYTNNLNEFFSVPHICIPLKRYLVDFIATSSVEKELETLNFLSKEELVLLKEMRKGKVKKIVIHYSKDKVDRIEVTRPLQKAQEARLAETFLSSEHADIEYTVAKGQIVKFEKTTKIKP